MVYFLRYTVSGMVLLISPAGSGIRDRLRRVRNPRQPPLFPHGPFATTSSFWIRPLLYTTPALRYITPANRCIVLPSLTRLAREWSREWINEWMNVTLYDALERPTTPWPPRTSCCVPCSRRTPVRAAIIPRQSLGTLRSRRTAVGTTTIPRQRLGTLIATINSYY